jgi:hypothetical protein
MYHRFDCYAKNRIVNEASYQIEIIKASYFFLALKKKLNKQNNRTPLYAGTESHRTRRIFYNIIFLDFRLRIE